jgi:hypothetical protein
MIHLYNAATDAYIGVITEEQFEFIKADLEEESSEDQDYYINQVTVDWLESQGADHELIDLLREALGELDEMDIRWERE